MYIVTSLPVYNPQRGNFEHRSFGVCATLTLAEALILKLLTAHPDDKFCAAKFLPTTYSSEVRLKKAKTSSKAKAKAKEKEQIAA